MWNNPGETYPDIYSLLLTKLLMTYNSCAIDYWVRSDNSIPFWRTSSASKLFGENKSLISFTLLNSTSNSYFIESIIDMTAFVGLRRSWITIEKNILWDLSFAFKSSIY